MGVEWATWKSGDRRVTVNFIDFGLEQQVERLWKLDQVKQTEDMSPNDLNAISVWQDTIKYEGGHYEVSIHLNVAQWPCRTTSSWHNSASVV
jgi:hypothetical protein